MLGYFEEMYAKKKKRFVNCRTKEYKTDHPFIF